MQHDSSVFKTPSFVRPDAYNFDITKESLSIYQELTAIAEEIEQCRQRNS